MVQWNKFTLILWLWGWNTIWINLVSKVCVSEKSLLFPVTIGAPAEILFELPLLRLVTFQPEGLHAEWARPNQSGILCMRQTAKDQLASFTRCLRAWRGQSQVELLRPDGPSMGLHRSALPLSLPENHRSWKMQKFISTKYKFTACESDLSLEMKWQQLFSHHSQSGRIRNQSPLVWRCFERAALSVSKLLSGLDDGGNARCISDRLQCSMPREVQSDLCTIKSLSRPPPAGSRLLQEAVQADLSFMSAKAAPI